MLLSRLSLAALASVLALALLVMSAPTATDAAGPTTLGRTPWQVFAPATYVAPVPNYGTHGNISYYSHAPGIPAVGDPAWLACGPGSPLRPSPYTGTLPLCPNSSTIAMNVGSRLPGCMTNVDFTFFQTLVDIPLGTTLSSFTIAMGGMDDGARITIFNSANPGGLVVPGSYVFLGGSGTANLAPHVVAGETNRVIITQMDDCAVGNNLGSAAVNLNGTVVPPVPTADLGISKTAPATAVVGSNINYTITVNNPSTTPVPAIVVTDTLPASVKFISAANPACTHNGALSGGIVTCSGISVPNGASVPLGITVQALTAGSAVNNVAITNLGGILDPNPANNQATATTNITPPPAPPAPPFTFGGPVVPGAKVCMPLYMDQNLQTQYWWVRAQGGALQVNFAAVGINAAETGSATVTVFGPGGSPIATHTVPYAGTATIPAPPVNVAAAAPGDLYRVEVIVAAPPSGPVARHYLVSASGATLIGTNSPLQPQAEHEDVRWRVNVDGAGLSVLLTPAPEAPLNTGSMIIINPAGTVVATVPLTPAGGAFSSPGAGAGQWRIAIQGADGHYLLTKTSGADRGLYLGWDAAGSGSITGTVTRGGSPNTIPVDIQVGGQTITGVLGSFTVPKQMVGTYTATIVGTSVTGTVTVTCDGVATITLDIPNTPPDAVDDSTATDEDTPVTVNVVGNDTDAEGNTLTVTAVSTPAHGTATFSGGSVVYTPAPNYHGPDSFTYTISDGNGGSDTATVSITVRPVNDPPDARDDTAATDEDVVVTVNVLSNDADVDGDTLSVTSVSTPAHGTAVIVPGGVEYTPAPNYHGPDSFTYEIADGRGGVDTATVNITVRPVNDPPSAIDDSATTTAGASVLVTVLANDTDIDGDTLTVASVGGAGNGTAVLNPDGTVTYTPAPGFSGDDTFEYTISDGNGGTSTATVTVHVDQFSGNGRMTGGGTYAIGNGRNAIRQTWGFTLYCDGSKGNLEFNDHATGGRFHLEQLLTTVCSDDPAVSQQPPSTPLDTLYMTGRGRWNNVQGALIEVTLVDGGEPGTADSVRLTVWNAGGTVVASVTGRLTGGNHQAHR